jgi:ribosomal large subunit pseudouridine synthase B (EC 5.4.99.-)
MKLILTFYYTSPFKLCAPPKTPEGRLKPCWIFYPPSGAARIYPVGRLDYFSEGLLLLTDDGDLTFRLTHPGWHMPRVYEVKVRGQVNEAKLASMRRGMTLQEGETLAPVEVTIKSQQENEIILALTYTRA